MPETTGNQQKWFTKTPEEIGKEINVDPQKGLSAAEAQHIA